MLFLSKNYETNPNFLIVKIICVNVMGIIRNNKTHAAVLHWGRDEQVVPT